MNNLDHYNREMKQIAQEAGKRKGVGGGLVAWLMMLVGVVVTGTMGWPCFSGHQCCLVFTSFPR